MDDHAAKYFREFVTPAFEEWLADQENERRAMTLAGCLNNIPDYSYQTLKEAGGYSFPEKVSIYRKTLEAKEPSLGLVRDVADAHKHLKLDRSTRTLTNADQTAPQSVGYGQGYGMRYGGGKALVLTLDDGSEEYFCTIVVSCYSHWKDSLGIRS